jgi:PAS domain S-box-containing protein
MTSAEAGAIDLLDRQQNTLSMLAGQGFPVEVCHARPWPLDQGVIGRVMRTGQPSLIADVSQDPDYTAVLPQTRSLLAVPLVGQGEVMGIIVLESPQTAAFGEDDRQSLMGLAGHAAIALENARLYKAVAGEKRKLEDIVNSIADGLYTTDGERRITTFNAAAEAITGWRAAEAIGQFCGDVLCLEDEKGQSLCRSEERCSIYWTLQQGYPNFSWEEKRFLVTKDGRRIPIAKITSPLRDDTGQVVGAVAAFWDASREMALEHLKDDFLSMVSHELRAPLTNIKAAAQLSLRRLDSLEKARQQELWGLIGEQCDRLIGFTDRILRISYLRAGRLNVERRPFLLLPLLEKAVSLYRIRAPGCWFEVWAQDSLWGLGDEGQTIIVLNTLLDNAVKFSPSGGTIRVEVAEDQEEVVLISVIDQGRGISSQELGRVFERSYRGHPEIDGYGLGLYLAKMLVEAQGGRIWLDSELGKGTQVHFTLPKA